MMTMGPEKSRQCRRLRQLTRQLTAAGPREVKPGDVIELKVLGTVAGTDEPAGLFKDDRAVFKIEDAPKGLLQPRLDQASRGLKVGDKVSLTISPDDKSHPQPLYDKELVAVFPTGGVDVKLGGLYKLTHKGVNRLAKVIEVDRAKSEATVDMNDPLAGKTLELDIELVRFDASARLQAERFPDPPSGIPDRLFELDELAKFNGVGAAGSPGKLYVSIRGVVYDVGSDPSGMKFYGPGGTYSFMAGKDATVGLAKFSFSPALMNTSWADLEDDQLQLLANYWRTFGEKYSAVGRLAPSAIPSS